MKKLLMALVMLVGFGFCFGEDWGEWKEDISFTGQESGIEYYACREGFLEYSTDGYSKTITFYVLGFDKEQIESISENVDVVEITDYYVVYRYSDISVIPCAHERI